MTARTHDHGPHCTCLSRRRLFGAAALGLAGLALPGAARAGGKAQALVLNCMDFRLVDEGVQYFNARGLRNNYDQVILAGASIGALGKLGPDWAATFWKHVETAKTLHHIEKVIVLDHRDCGAYKIVFGADSIADKSIETALHRSQMILLREELKKRHPEMGFEGALMGLNGWVENLFPGEGARVDYRPKPKPKPVETATTAQPAQPAMSAEVSAQAPPAPQPIAKAPALDTHAAVAPVHPAQPAATPYSISPSNVPIETAAPAPVSAPPVSAPPAPHAAPAAIGSPAGGHGH
jgi:hypothetical protein